MKETTITTKNTLFIGNKEVHNTIEGKIKKRSNVILVYNDNEFQLFDNCTGEKLFYWKGKYFLRGSYIRLNDEKTNTKAAISYRGIYLVPFEIGAIYLYNVQKSKTAFFVELKDKKGCYFSNVKQFVECFSARKDKTRFSGSYELLINNIWKRYVLRNGRFVPARYEKICYYS